MSVIETFIHVTQRVVEKPSNLGGIVVALLFVFLLGHCKPDNTNHVASDPSRPVSFTGEVASSDIPQ
jgi:hypothetical protein